MQQVNIEEGQIKITGEERDVATYSGGEATFTSICFITACCRVIQAAYMQIDEWDVYMDSARRMRAFQMLVEVILHSSLQTVLVTPNDVDLEDQSLHLDPQYKALIGVIRLETIVRQ